MVVSERAHAFNRAVGLELRAERARRGFTRPKLAQESGLAVSTIQRFETGQRSPDVVQLITLCCALGISPVTIFARAEEHRKVVHR